MALSSAADAPIWAVKGIETGKFIGMIFLGRHNDSEDMEVSRAGPGNLHRTISGVSA